MYFKPANFFITILIALLISCGKAEELDVSEKNRHNFNIEGCKLTFNDINVYLGSHVDTWINKLGENYRIAAYGSRYLWDDIGIYLNVENKSKKVNSITFMYSYPPKLISYEKQLEKAVKEKNHYEIKSIKYMIDNRLKSYFHGKLILDGAQLGKKVNFHEIKEKRFKYFNENYDKYKDMNIGFNTFRQSYTPERWAYNTNCPNGEEYGFIYLLIDENTASSLTIGN